VLQVVAWRVRIAPRAGVRQRREKSAGVRQRRDEPAG
jgi:hypothetical protein